VLRCRAVLLSVLTTAFVAFAGRSKAAELPPAIVVKDHGNISRDRFPVTGGIPFPQGALQEEQLPRLALASVDGKEVPVQYAVTCRWPDGSVKWLLLDFQSSQASGQAASFHLKPLSADRMMLEPMVRQTADGVRVMTGGIEAAFEGDKVLIRTLRDGKRQTVVDGKLLSVIGVVERAGGATKGYALNLSRPTVELNGPMRAVLKFQGWHTSEDGDKFSPSVIRMSFYRDSTMFKVDHHFIFTKNPDTHMISRIALDMPLLPEVTEARFNPGKESLNLPIAGNPVGVYQANDVKITYPPETLFVPRFQVLGGAARNRANQGDRYRGAMVLSGPQASLGVFLKDMWQLAPKALTYDPQSRTLSVGVWPGEHAGNMDLMRVEVSRPEHFREYMKQEAREYNRWKGYCPCNLTQSAMGVGKTHEIVFDFAAEDPQRLAAEHAQPFTPFISPEWNVRSGAMGSMLLPGTYLKDLEAVIPKLADALLEEIEKRGWYGMFNYGDVQYVYRADKKRWMNYNPKYGWFNSGHVGGGGGMLQAFWYLYLRTGDPRYYRFAEARGRHKMDVDVVEWHENEGVIGSMVRHSGWDHWAGNHSTAGVHMFISGFPECYWITGYQRAHDISMLLGKLKASRFERGYGRQTDAAFHTTAQMWELTRGEEYYRRCLEYVDWYHQTVIEAPPDERVYSQNYGTRQTAVNYFYHVCPDEKVKAKLRRVFLADFGFYNGKGVAGRWPREAYGLACEMAPVNKHKRVLEEMLFKFREMLKEPLEMGHPMLVNMNSISYMNTIPYVLEQARRVNAEPRHQDLSELERDAISNRPAQEGHFRFFSLGAIANQDPYALDIAEMNYREPTPEVPDKPSVLKFDFGNPMKVAKGYIGVSVSDIYPTTAQNARIDKNLARVSFGVRRLYNGIPFQLPARDPETGNAALRLQNKKRYEIPLPRQGLRKIHILGHVSLDMSADGAGARYRLVPEKGQTRIFELEADRDYDYLFLKLSAVDKALWTRFIGGTRFETIHLNTYTIDTGGKPYGKLVIEDLGRQHDLLIAAITFEMAGEPEPTPVVWQKDFRVKTPSGNFEYRQGEFGKANREFSEAPRFNAHGMWSRARHEETIAAPDGTYELQIVADGMGGPSFKEEGENRYAFTGGYLNVLADGVCVVRQLQQTLGMTEVISVPMRVTGGHVNMTLEPVGDWNPARLAVYQVTELRLVKPSPGIEDLWREGRVKESAVAYGIYKLSRWDPNDLDYTGPKYRRWRGYLDGVDAGDLAAIDGVGSARMQLVFHVDVPDGGYRVRLQLSGMRGAKGRYYVEAEGKKVLENLTFKPSPTWHEFQTDVADGQLTFALRIYRDAMVKGWSWLIRSAIVERVSDTR